MTQSWDLLIQGAKVFDGSGALPSIQDVAIRNGKVAARGDSLPADAATEVVDGRNQWLVPPERFVVRCGTVFSTDKELSLIHI